MTPSDGAARSADPELLLRDQRWLVALARSLVGDEHAAEDVVQEARIAAWLHAPGDPSRAGGWLRRVVRNLSIRVRRSDTRRLAREQTAAPHEATPATDELVARVEMQRAVAEAVLALDEPYRSAILLRFFDRLPPRDIAARLGAPVETVRTRLKRALEQLRAKLDRDFGARDAWAALLLPWTTVATATTKVGLKVAVAAVLIGTAGIATWEGARRASMRANEGGAQVAAASATGPTEAPRATGGDPTTTADGAVRSEDDAARVRLPDGATGAIHVTARIVDASTRAPIAGARFSARAYPSHGPAEASTPSDSDGRIVLDFGSAESRWFQYDVTHSDHAQLDGQKNFDGSDNRAASDRRRVHDFGELALERGASVAGRVVRWPERTPVAGAKLLIVRSGFETGFWLSGSAPVGESRFDGSFELDERIASRGHSPILYAVTPIGIGWISPTIVKGRDRIDGVEIEVETPAHLDMQVVDESGAPISGVSVFALPRFPPFGPSSDQRLSWDSPRSGPGAWCDIFEATTARDGRAVLPFVPEGRDDEVLSRGGGNSRTYTVFAHPAVGQRRTAVASVRIEHGKTTDVKLVARRLVPQSIRGCVSDDRGRPVADARVDLDRVGSATTDEAGLYELPPFTADRDRLGFRIAADGFGDDEQELLDSKLGSRIVPVRGDDGVVTREELTIDFTLSSRLTVKGRCIDVSGNGVAKVGVEVQQYDAHSSSPTRRRGVTDDGGNFQIDGVMPGEASLAISPPRGFRSVSSRTVKAGAQDVEVRLVVEPASRARIVADLVDAGTQQPAEVENAYLYPVDYGGWSPACALAVGSATAEGLHLGRWWISIRAANGSRAYREFEVTDPDEEVRLHLEVAPCASIDGQVTRSDGQPFPSNDRPMIFLRAGTNFANDGGYSVELDGRASTDVSGGCCARVDPDGSFRIAGILPRTSIRLYSLDPMAVGEAVVVLEPGEKLRVEIVTKPGTEVSFRFPERVTSGRFRLEVAREDGRFGLVTQENSIRDGDIWKKACFAPGLLHWRVTHSSEEDEIPYPRTVEGDLEVVAGRPQVVDIRGLK